MDSQEGWDRLQAAVRKAVDGLYAALDEMLADEDAERQSRPAVEKALNAFVLQIWKLPEFRAGEEGSLFDAIDRIRPRLVDSVYQQISQDNRYTDRLSDEGERYGRFAVYRAFAEVTAEFFELYVQILHDELAERERHQRLQNRLD